MRENQQNIISGCFEPSPFRFKVKIVGIGGAALRILDKFPAESFDNQTFIAVGGDDDLLNCQKSHVKFSVDDLNRDTDRRRLSFEDKRQAVLDNAFDVGWLFRDADLAIIIVCLGGETGSEVARVLANISCLEAGLTLVFAVTPAEFESSERQKRAETALKELDTAADTVFHIPLTDARFLGETANPSEVFARFDEVVVGAVRAVTESLYSSDGLCCVDFPDLRSLFGAGKKGYVAMGQANGEERAVQVLENALGDENLLIGGARLKDAKSVWMHIEGDENLCLDEVQEIVSQVENLCPESTNIIFAPIIKKGMNDKIRLTLLASGYD